MPPANPSSTTPPAPVVPRRRGRPPGPTVDREQRRRDLLAGAQRAIQRVGAHASMEEIAAEAGITKPILYDHFGDKAGLARALADQVAEELRLRLVAVLATSADPRSLTHDGIASFLTFIEAEPALYEFLVQGEQLGGNSSVTQRRLISRLGMQIADSLQAHLGAIDGDVGLAAPWSFAIIGSVVVAAEWWVGTRTIDAQQLAEALTDFIWDGVGSTARLRAPEA